MDEKSEGPQKVMVKHNVLEGSCFSPILGTRVYRVDNVLLVHSEVVNGRSLWNGRGTQSSKGQDSIASAKASWKVKSCARPRKVTRICQIERGLGRDSMNKR